MMHEELVNILLYDAGWLEQGITQTEHDIAEHLKKAADAIEELSKPVVHAHWYVDDGCAYCSNCRNNFKKAIMTHARFCPYCGAKMEEPNDRT